MRVVCLQRRSFKKVAWYLALYTGQILVVEDDIPNSRAVTLALKTAGHEPVTEAKR
jgi:hypothetical protein